MTKPHPTNYKLVEPPVGIPLGISGSRGIKAMSCLVEGIDAADFYSPITIVHGGADGVDTLAKRYIAEHHLNEREFPVSPDDWTLFGRNGPKNAGYRRNTAMAEYLAQWRGRLIAIWDGSSSGTAHMIRECERLRVPHYVHIPAEYRVRR